MARLTKLPLPVAMPTDAPLKQVCINEDWLQVIMNVCTRLEWPSSWAVGVDVDAAEQRVFDLYAMFRAATEGGCGVDCCDDILDRLSGIEAALDAQSRLDLASRNTTRAITSKAQRDALEDLYDGSPTSIHTSAPTDKWDGTGHDRLEDLCAALMGFVYNFAQFKADQLRAAQIGGLLALVAVGLLLIPGLNVFFIIGASIALGAGMSIIGVSTETAIEALTDKDALDAVVCAMKAYLKGKAVNTTTFQASLSAAGFGSGTHAQIVADFLIASTLADNYLTFLSFAGEAHAAILRGDTVPACPCDDVPPTCFEFAIDLQDWTTYTDTGAQWHSGIGIGQNLNTYLTILAPLGDDTEVSEVSVKFTRAWTGVNDFDKFFIQVANSDLTNAQSFGNIVLLYGGPSFTFTSTGSPWVRPRIQVVAGGLTWPSNQYIEEICINP